MRVALVLLALFAVVILGAKEVLWRIDGRVAEMSAASPSGSTVAEVRSMSEDSVVPYGQGVFVYSHGALLRSVQAELAFAGYCGTINLHWVNERQLGVVCDLIEGVPHVNTPVGNGISIEVTLRKNQASTSAP